MGELYRLPLAQWRVEYGLIALLETGTYQGAGVRAALGAGFARVTTIDVVPRCLERGRAAAAELGKESQVECILGDSAEVLPAILPTFMAPAMFWLDAHYPDVYSEKPLNACTLPMLAEVKAIVESPRSHAFDVILCDDLRIYGTDGTSGPLPARSQEIKNGQLQNAVPLQAGEPGELEEMVNLLNPTHELTLVKRDGCYLVATPRSRP